MGIQKKLLAATLVLLAAGALMGAAGMRVYLAGEQERRWDDGPQEKRDRIMKRLTRELDLTAEQRAEIEPIVTHTQVQMLALRIQQHDKMRLVMDAGMAALKLKLTPEQQGKLDGVRARIDRRWQKMEAYVRNADNGGEAAPKQTM
jgi:hypothetical protein